ncbi:hypothetical protein N7509_006016 [Penicillium cosmopolitanum]|uniref:Uncharacterized protein n=1 Tax=Penicillium cosmopolitanum TaxID=1131564 RepID=A0A9W9W3M9_9EURO|nr:uncharacterized protein N7509_006016 [Penicillium cosmopolitanum]KAJ5397903.1 hypothetical protein N7509_006016 [Penicillium cosmopolitanum]
MSGKTSRLEDSTPALKAPVASDPSGLDPSRQPGDTAQPGKPRRRRRPADSGPQPKNQFYFVDSSSSSKEKRAHVMRHHVQEKRKQRKLSHESLQPEQIQDALSWQTTKDPEYETDPQMEPAVSGAQGPPPDPNSSLRIRFSNVNPAPQSAVSLQLGSPRTMLDASRKDPFSSLPIAHDPENLELVDYWTTKLTYWSGQNPYVKNQIFRTAMDHPVTFQAVILTYCARWKAQIYGITDSPEVIRHVGQSRKNIDDASRGITQVPPDQLAMALSGMALGEERFGDKSEGRRCLEQALHLMRPRPGFNPSVEVFLHYVRFIMLPQNTEIDPADLQWLVSFLWGAQSLMQRHSSPDYLAHTPQRRDAFEMQSPLFSLLSSGPRPSQVPQAARMYVVRDAQTQEISRTAALIYITTALRDFKDSASKCGRFIQYLCTTVEHHQLDRQHACETLLWLLLEQGCDPDLQAHERAWSTGELLLTHKQLRPDQQFHFNEILMSFLTLRAPIRGIDIFEKELNKGGLW